ncbi:MAG: hypothetical protein GF355_17855, partial [Candidatus Eisenbacteria bacterium]|nr:hypothetical protein [Candidatus Eisenbacteria bacterium]
MMMAEYNCASWLGRRVFRARPAALVVSCLAAIWMVLLGFGCGSDDDKPPAPDTTPPEAVSDLSVASVTDSSATLAWTAPGDDGGDGTAAAYDVRYSISAITNQNWSAADSAGTPPVPQTAGSDEVFTVEGLAAGTRYYFALKAVDDDSNWSDLSNVPSDTTSGGVEPDDPIPGVFPDSLNLGAEQSEATFTITNTGTGTLTWQVSTDEAWLSAFPDSGSTATEEDEVTVTVDRTGLDPGDYSGQVTVTAAGADPEVVTVLMTVLEDPILMLSTDLIQFGCEANERTFTIANSGSGTLRWTITNDQPWITVDPDTGSTGEETDGITVTVDRTGLDPGDYSGAVTVSPEVGSPQEIAVEVCVPEEPVLEVDPQSLQFGSEETE